MLIHACSLGLPNPNPAQHFSPPPRLPSNPLRIGQPKHRSPLTLIQPKKPHSHTHRLRALQGPESPKEQSEGFKTENPPQKNIETPGTEKTDDPKSTTPSVGEEGKGRKGEELFLSGVLEEIQQIEWPGFGKVLGTTGVVLAVIAGSSVVLLTVNAVLAEISDKIFAGKGVQDFFG